MAENAPVNNGGIFAKLAKIFAIISLFFVLLPLVVKFLSFLVILNWLTAPLAVIFAIVSIVKMGQTKKAIVWGVIGLICFLLPIILKDTYAKNAAEGVAGAFDSVRGMGGFDF